MLTNDIVHTVYYKIRPVISHSVWRTIKSEIQGKVLYGMFPVNFVWDERTLRTNIEKSYCEENQDKVNKLHVLKGLKCQ